ncbi:MAG: DNA-binding NtrC family response regulator [Phenylobacterium sp.]|jgi:DNA-binding NtrC family response regulator
MNDSVSNSALPIHILVVEDENDQREIICDLLEAEGYLVSPAASVEDAIVHLKANPTDMVFSDWNLGTLSGLDLLNYVRKTQPDLHPEIGFVVATAYGSINHAVSAIKAGADDYLSKPFQRQELLLAITKSLTARSLRQHNQHLSQQLGEQQNMVDLIGHAPCMQKVFDRIKRVSNTDATVLITGESGTGKELAARALQQLSGRRNGPFIAINCGAIPESIAEAELFGAEKGAFTGATSTKIGKFEAAHEGTIFLDEIGELSLSIQAKILRLLQESTVTRLGANNEIKLDVRIVAATHRDLPQRIQDGEFREDLYYRLNIVPIEMPPLRERQEDIPRLINHFIDINSRRYNTPSVELEKTALKQLIDYHWPGNVRELSNRIERFILLGDADELVLGLSGAVVAGSDGSYQLPDEGLNWEDFEKQCLAQALTKNDRNRTKAAKFLQLPYKAFLYRLEKYGLN